MGEDKLAMQYGDILTYNINNKEMSTSKNF